MEETLLLEKRTKNRAPSLCIGGGIRTHTVTLASDFESGAFNVPKKATAQGVVVAVFYSTVGSQSNRNNAAEASKQFDGSFACVANFEMYVSNGATWPA